MTYKYLQYICFTLIVFIGVSSCISKSYRHLNNYSAYFINDTSSSIPKGAVRVTFLGTTTLLLDDGETQLMTDGFFTRPSMLRVGFAKLKTDTALVNYHLSKLNVNRLKGLFVAHSHYDHALDVAYVAKTTHAKLFGSSSTLNIGRGGGLPEEQLSLYEPGKEIMLGKFSVTILPSKHANTNRVVNDNGEYITKPLYQPIRSSAYVEGGSCDLLIKHNGHSILIKPSCNYIEGALDTIQADVVFLGVATLAKQTQSFQTNYYNQTIGKVSPNLVIPIHWDNFFKPLQHPLVANYKLIDHSAKDFDCIIKRTQADTISFKILQGYQSITLFK